MGFQPLKNNKLILCLEFAFKTIDIYLQRQHLSSRIISIEKFEHISKYLTPVKWMLAVLFGLSFISSHMFLVKFFKIITKP